MLLGPPPAVESFLRWIIWLPIAVLALIAIGFLVILGIEWCLGDKIIFG